MRRTVLISMAAAPLGAVLSSRVFAQAPEKSKVTIAVGGKAAGGNSGGYRNPGSIGFAWYTVHDSGAPAGQSHP